MYKKILAFLLTLSTIPSVSYAETREKLTALGDSYREIIQNENITSNRGDISEMSKEFPEEGGDTLPINLTEPTAGPLSNGFVYDTMALELRDENQLVEAGYQKITPEPVPEYINVNTEKEQPDNKYTVDWSDMMDIQNLADDVESSKELAITYLDKLCEEITVCSIDDSLKNYFTDQEIRDCVFSHPHRFNEEEKRLLVAFLELSDVDVLIKKNLLYMIKKGLDVSEAIHTYNECISSLKDTSEFSNHSIMENIDSILLTDEENGGIQDNSALYRYADENGLMQLRSSGSEWLIREDIWQNEALEEKYYGHDAANINIEGKLGSVSERRNDISIPLRSGVNLECPIVYNSNEAYACTYGNEYYNVNNWRRIYYDYEHTMSPFGIGWYLGLTYMCDGVVVLEDGRSFKINRTRNNKQTDTCMDVSFIYNSSDQSADIHYIDGRTEHLPELSFEHNRVYIDQKTDKYGVK